MNEERKEFINANVIGLVSDLLYYDRKEDEDLPRDEIEKAIEEGDISIEDIVSIFTKELYLALWDGRR